jgi:hypothetical protein
MSPTLRCTGAARLRPNSARYTRSAGMSPQSLTDGLSTSDVKFLNIVKDFGWHVMKVAPRVGDEERLWAYSTGLYYSYGHPEILMLNLQLDSMHEIINLIGASVKKGKTFEPGKPYADILERFNCSFQSVLPAYYEEYVGFSMWFYEGDSFPILQCFWPDTSNRFPWQPDCDADVRESQPLLYLPPAVN